MAINFIELGSLLFEVTKNFRIFQKMMRRLLRGSSSQSSKEKAPKPKFNLSRTTKVRACEWPSENFMDRA